MSGNKICLLANLSKDGLVVYLRLLTTLFNSLLVSVLGPTSFAASQNTQVRPIHEEDSDDEDSSHLHFSTGTSPPPPVPALDTRTLKRIQTLPDSSHISVLLGIAKSHPSIHLEMITFLLALKAGWPTEILAAAGLYGPAGGDLVS